MRLRPFAFAFSILLYAQASVAQFSGITGTGDGINYQYYGTITTALNEVRPFGIYATSADVYIDFWQSGFTSGVDLTSATLYYKINSSTFGTANDASWTQVTGTLSAVPSSDNDRATFTLTGIAPGTDIMFYIRAQTTTGGFRDGYAYPGQALWSTTAPSSQAQTYKIRFNKAAAYNTIRIDGRPHDWQATSQIAARSTASTSRTLDIMWDNTYIYFLINEGFSASAGDRIHFGFDRNPGAGGNANGTQASFSGASFPENYRPDIIFRARGTGLGTWTNDRGVADGSNGWTYTGDIGNSPTSNMWSVSGTNTTLLEVRIARSAIGSFDSLGVFVWLSNSSDNLYDSFPHGNTASNGLMPIQIGFPNLNDGTVPRDDGYFDGQYNHTSSFNIFGIKRYRNLRISSPTGVEIGISNLIDSLTVTGDLRIDADATLRPNAVQTITMKGAPGNIINNGFMNASPAFMNDLNFVIDSVVTLSGSSPVDVFNLTINADDTLKVTGTNLRTGNTGTITVNGTIEFGETNIVQSWGGTANFTLNSGATLITANQNGVNGTANGDSSTFNGTIRVGGTVTYNNNATYIFSRNGDQTVGFLQRGNLPAITQANRLVTLTRPTTRAVTLESDFPLTAALSQPALNVGANTTLNISSFDLIANGNLSGSGTISGTGNVIVSSTPSAIQIGGLTFDTDLDLQDPDGATLIANASVTNSGSLKLGSNVKLTLQSGVTLSLNNAPLTISNPETEHIITQTNARLRRSMGASETKLFPVATSGSYFPLEVTTSAVTGGDVAVGVDGTNPASGRMGNGTFAVQTIYHVQAPSFNFGSGTVSLNFGWLTGAEGTNFDRTKSFPARWTGSMWESYRTNSGLTRNNVPTVKQVTITGLTVLQGEWAVFAADDDSPLPVSLTDFTARATPRGIELLWRTATEQENLGFIVLRNGEELASYLTHHALRGNGTTLTESQYTFLDNAVEVGRTYTYRLRSVDFSGTIHDYELTAIATAIEKIASFELFQNYPNPFNPTTVIRYQLPVKSEVKLELFDVLGRKLATLVSATQDAGSYTVSVSASALNLSSGVYLYRLTAGTFMDTKKMLFVK